MINVYQYCRYRATLRCQKQISSALNQSYDLIICSFNSIIIADCEVLNGVFSSRKYELIGSLATNEDVLPRATKNSVLPRTAMNGVLLSPPRSKSSLRPPLYEVTACFAFEQVFSFAAFEGVLPRTAMNGVMLSPAAKQIVITTTS